MALQIGYPQDLLVHHHVLITIAHTCNFEATIFRHIHKSMELGIHQSIVLVYLYTYVYIYIHIFIAMVKSDGLSPTKFVDGHLTRMISPKCIYIHIYIDIHAYIYTYIYIYIHASIYKHIYIYIHTYTYTYTHIYIYM